MADYPQLVINTAKIKSNTQQIISHCRELGIGVWAVVKVVWADEKVVRAMIEGGADVLATSRLNQMKFMRSYGITNKMALLRVPQPCELEEVAELADYSLQSDLDMMRRLNDVCKAKGKKHKVVVMFDLGDLREGFWNREEGIEACLAAEYEMDSLELAGVGVNLGCYGTIQPTVDKMQDLCDIAAEIESRIGRKLEIVSGGATSSYGMVFDKTMPKGINNLRVGEMIIDGVDVPIEDYTVTPDYIYYDTITVRTQIVELRTKASRPQGTFFRDAFRGTPDFPDKGDRLRALVALGRGDIGNPSFLLKREEGVDVLGGSSDHTIADVEDCARELKVGDILEFGLTYGGAMFATESLDLVKVYTDEI